MSQRHREDKLHRSPPKRDTSSCSLLIVCSALPGNSAKLSSIPRERSHCSSLRLTCKNDLAARKHRSWRRRGRYRPPQSHVLCFRSSITAPKLSSCILCPAKTSRTSFVLPNAVRKMHENGTKADKRLLQVDTSCCSQAATLTAALVIPPTAPPAGPR